MLSSPVYAESCPRQAPNFSLDRSLSSLFSLFAARVFHNSFPIKRFHTLSKKCRVYTNNSRSGTQPLQRIAISFHFILFQTVLRVFAFPQNATRLLSDSSELLAKNTGDGQGAPGSERVRRVATDNRPSAEGLARTTGSSSMIPLGNQEACPATEESDPVARKVEQSMSRARERSARTRSKAPRKSKT